jgi:SRSO17 transposase
VLVIDETGDRKWGNQTAHVGRQYLGSIGKIDNGVVSVSSLWANEQIYYPIDVAAYTPASWFEEGKGDPQFQTKPEIALELVRKGREWGLPFRAVVADSFYGDHLGFQEGLAELGVGYVLALKPSHGWWHLEGDIGCVVEVAQAHGWQEQAPGAWVKLIRRFRDGHEEVWWILEAQAGPYGVAQSQRLVIATTDPKELPEPTTWYLVTNLPTPDSPRSRRVKLAPASLSEVVRLYGLRVWVEQSYKQVKQTLGWAQYQVRSSLAIRRHWQLVFCAFSFCWWAAGQAQGKGIALGREADQPSAVEDLGIAGTQRVAEGGKGRTFVELAGSPAEGTGVAGALLHAAALLASVVRQTPSRTITNVA